jgi:hypothetical protein
MPFSETKKNKGRHTTAQGNLSQLAQPTSNPTDNLNQKQSQPNKPQEEVVHTENHSQQQLNKKTKSEKNTPSTPKIHRDPICRNRSPQPFNNNPP